MSLFKTIAGLLLAGALAACGGGGGNASTPGTGGGGGGVSASPVASLLLTVQSGSPSSIPATGSTSTTITVRALDASNGLVKNANVALSVSGNVILSSSTVQTDPVTGLATVTLSANSIDQTSRTAIITANCVACSAPAAILQVPVTGATLSVTPTSLTPMYVGGNIVNVKATVQGASQLEGIPVTFTSTDNAIVGFGAQATTVLTDALGSASINISALSVGSANVNVNAIGNAKAVSFTVAAPIGTLTVTSPADKSIVAASSPATLVPITVSAPGASSVTFASTVGTFSGGASFITVPVSGGVAIASLSSTTGGTANVTVTDSKSRNTSLTLYFSLPISAANQVFLTASQTIVKVSTGGATNFVRLTARAVNNTGGNAQGVANVPILFSMDPVPNAGEYLTPAMQLTDGSGFATANFYSGQQVTSQPIRVTATIQNSAPAIAAHSDLSIGGTALSVAFGPASVIRTSVDNTLYILDYSVQVTDATGSPVPNATVTLRVRPVAFSQGTQCLIRPDATNIGSPATYCSEDFNANGSLDPNEDGVRYLTTVATASKCSDPGAKGLAFVTTGVPSFTLTPQNAVSGSVPSTVITDVNGVAPFSLTYLKGSAIWVVDQITASVSVSGTESSASTIFQLPASTVDVDLPKTCLLQDSPFNND